MSKSNKNRQEKIIELIEARHSISIAELKEYFHVSEMSIRRDLRALEAKGIIFRVHGGAISAWDRGYSPPYITRKSKFKAEKERIGRLAASLVNDGESIALDVGTTTFEVAQHLTEKKNLTIITPSFNIANLLLDHSGVRIILTGGILRPGELSMVGHLAERAVREFYVDKLFLGAGGIDLKAGITEYNLEDAAVKRSMLTNAKSIYVVADSSKFGKVALAAVAPLSSINCIITDSSINKILLSKLQTMGVKILVA